MEKVSIIRKFYVSLGKDSSAVGRVSRNGSLGLLAGWLSDWSIISEIDTYSAPALAAGLAQLPLVASAYSSNCDDCKTIKSRQQLDISSEWPAVSFTARLLISSSSASPQDV